MNHKKFILLISFIMILFFSSLQPLESQINNDPSFDRVNSNINSIVDLNSGASKDGGIHTNQAVTPDPWEDADDDYTGATTLVAGTTTASHTMELADDDWYTFTMADNLNAILQTYSTVDGDTELYLYNSTLNEIAHNDDSDGLQSYITMPLSGGTTYYVLVIGYGNNTEFDEYTLFFNLVGIDTDSDGVSDDDEIGCVYGCTDPNNSDTDGDGLTDGAEIFNYNTNPLVQDTDGDGVRDDVEVEWGSNPNDIADYPVGDAWENTDDNPFSATPLLFGTTPQHNIENPEDRDWFTFSLNAEAIISLYTQIEPGDDTILYLHNSSGHLIEKNDDYKNLESNITRYLPAGLYYAYVRGYETSLVTGYNLTMVQLSFNASYIDSDLDGLSDILEINTYNTDPYNRDTDGDGATDGDEVNIPGTFSNLNSDPLNADSDGDGFLDGLESSVIFSDAMNSSITPVDTDGDRLTDFFETELYGQFYTSANSADTDGDGFDDLTEIILVTLPSNPASFPTNFIADEDADGLTYTEEWLLGTDPFNLDSDFDGLSDGDELNLFGTDPIIWDTDSDGFLDGDEISQGFDPLDPTSNPNQPTSNNASNSDSNSNGASSNPSQSSSSTPPSSNNSPPQEESSSNPPPSEDNISDTSATLPLPVDLKLVLISLSLLGLVIPFKRKK